ncbi:hypothetical protein VNO80_05452 [Phaseolus coccineus]|uniref:Uncharacterized protein n=1 Tax=Phaseolus coccineus TaxID=3886 RepID=A0AAN9NLZ4_PHACN
MVGIQLPKLCKEVRKKEKREGRREMQIQVGVTRKTIQNGVTTNLKVQKKRQELATIIQITIQKLDRESRSRARGSDAGLDNQPKRSDREGRTILWHDDDTFKEREKNSRREEKGSRRYGDDEFEHKSREERYRREEKKSRRDDYDGIPEPKGKRRGQ